MVPLAIFVSVFAAFPSFLSASFGLLMATVCFRGGCLTGPNHSGAELHGFLACLARAVKEGRVYRVYG